jgi:hypothetical protein
LWCPQRYLRRKLDIRTEKTSWNYWAGY